MSAQRPDVVIYCAHGERGAQHGPSCDHCSVVERCRWLTEQAVWIGTKRPEESQTFIYPGDVAQFPFWEDDPPVHERIRWSRMRCACGETVPARDEKVQPVLTLLSTRGVTTLSIQGLRVALENSPARRRRQLRD